MGLSKIQNLEDRYGTTKAQLPRKVSGAQSFISKKHTPPKAIGSWA
jgi:hypothetical protein